MEGSLRHSFEYKIKKAAKYQYIGSYLDGSYTQGMEYFSEERLEWESKSRVDGIHVNSNLIPLHIVR